MSTPERPAPKALRPDGGAIRAIRQQRGMSTVQLAEKVGRSYSQLANVENGHRSTRPEILYRIAHALGVDIGQITRGENGNGGESAA